MCSHCAEYVLCDVLHILVSIVLFQAEDGIRYLVRSRGLGDVYKRQVHEKLYGATPPTTVTLIAPLSCPHVASVIVAVAPVSYTHLTLPTSDLV